MLSRLDRKRELRAPAQLKEATVLDPPLNDDGWMRVEIDGQAGVVRECPWMPRADAVPLAEDAAAVLESDEANIWVVCWWPQAER